MDQTEIEKNISNLQDEITRLKTKKRDAWDKVSVVGSVTLPFVIAMVGYLLTANSKRQDREYNERTIKITQGQMINLFIAHLTDTNALKRQLAIKTISYVLDSSISRSLVQTVLYNDTNPGVTIQAREFLKDSVTPTRSLNTPQVQDDAVSNLFSNQKEKRINASNDILTNYTKTEEILTKLLTKVRMCLAGNDANADCDNGLYNAMVVLPYFSKSLLAKHKQEIEDLVKSIPDNKPLTQSQGANLLKKIE